MKGLSSRPLKVEKLLVIAPKKSVEVKNKISRLLDSETGTRLEKFLAKRRQDWKETQIAVCSGLERDEFDIGIVSPKEGMTSFELLEFFKTQLKAFLDVKTKSFGLLLVDAKVEEPLFVECFAAALATRIFLMPSYGQKAKEQKPYALRDVVIASEKDCTRLFDYGFETGEATNRIRAWGSTPPNELNAEGFGKLVRKLCTQHKLSLKFYSKSELKRMGAGAFTAVDQGNPDSKGGIYELSYLGRGAKNKKPVCLVGKGLCFDTGGYDIKTGQSMIGMKGDMQGAAVALSTLVAAARMKWPLKIKAFLGVTENHISPKAYKADEVVMALNGTSIEVVNTDAEGRMVLADTLTLASRQKPELLIDFATLTGMAVYSIGKNYAAGFTNHESFHSLIVECGKTSGERVWTFPLDKDYGKLLESSVADTLQCSKSRGVDHILAAFFLQKFVEKDVPWIHIDLSASEKAGGLAHTDTEYTGFGARWSLELLKQHFKLKL